MTDLGLSSSGTNIVQASSFDTRYPPKCIVDGRMDTFWMTTGMYPQQFVLKLPGLHVLEKIAIQTYNVQDMAIERTNSEEPVKFELITTKTLQHQAGKLQTETVSPPSSQNVTANYLRFRILSGHAPFISVHRMSITGRETRTPIAMDRPPSGEQGTRVIRTARPPSAARPLTPPTAGSLAPSTAGPLAPPTANRARSVSPAALNLTPAASDFPGSDDGRARSQADVARAASAAPSLFQGLEFNFDGLETTGADAAEVGDGEDRRQDEGEDRSQDEGEDRQQDEGEDRRQDEGEEVEEDVRWQ